MKQLHKTYNDVKLYGYFSIIVFMTVVFTLFWGNM
jgi:hypothetical protein